MNLNLILSHFSAIHKLGSIFGRTDSFLKPILDVSTPPFLKPQNPWNMVKLVCIHHQAATKMVAGWTSRATLGTLIPRSCPFARSCCRLFDKTSESWGLPVMGPSSCDECPWFEVGETMIDTVDGSEIRRSPPGMFFQPCESWDKLPTNWWTPDFWTINSSSIISLPRFHAR